MNDNNIALIDIDATIADYDRRMAEELLKISSPTDPPIPIYGEGIQEEYIKSRQKLIKNQPGFWENLPRLELGFQIVDELRTQGFSLHVLTKGPNTTISAWTEKVKWCKKNIPDALITITQDKSIVYGRILVDDWPPFFNGWLEYRPRGLVICVKHPWNEAITHPQVIIYDGSESSRKELRDRIVAARKE